MKVILLQEVKGKGSEGDVVEVARGYAVNYLLPRKAAIEATSGNLKQLEARKHNIEQREGTRRDEASRAAAAIEGKVVRIAAKAGDEGRLYGSITGQMIADALVEQLDVGVDKRKLDVHGHIKALGEHTVGVRLHKDVHVELVVKVVAEGAADEPHEPTITEVLELVDAEEAIEEAAESGEVAADEAIEESAEIEPMVDAGEPAGEDVDES